MFYGAVAVPDEAGNGEAKVTFSFSAWKEGGVAPSTIRLPIVDSEKRQNHEADDDA